MSIEVEYAVLGHSAKQVQTTDARSGSDLDDRSGLKGSAEETEQRTRGTGHRWAAELFRAKASRGQDVVLGKVRLDEFAEIDPTGDVRLGVHAPEISAARSVNQASTSSQGAVRLALIADGPSVSAVGGVEFGVSLWANGVRGKLCFRW